MRGIAALVLGASLCGASARADPPPDAGTPPPPRLTFAVEGLASLATADGGDFNETDYGASALRLARLRVDGSLRLGPRAALLAEARLDNADGPDLAALFVRVRPLPARRL